MFNALLRVLLKPLALSRAPGVRDAAEALRRELKIDAAHRATARRLRGSAMPEPVRLNLGCGRNKKAGWINVDLRSHAEYRIDLRRPWPIPDATTEVVYSEHVFEHFAYPEEARHFLAEALRVLRPGGTLSLGVPDTGLILEDFAAGREDAFRRAKEKGWHPAWCDMPLHSVNYHFRQGEEHKYAYDAETLVRVIEQAGFADVGRRAFDPDLDSPEWELGTLYVQARRPETTAR